MTTVRDALIAYASEDKKVAQAITDALAALGFSVWFDEYELRVGDSLSRKIDEGLRVSRCGVVLLSPSFFAKNWPQSELGGLKALQKRILPVWHEIDVDQVKKSSPTLADIRATKTVLGVDRVTKDIAEALRYREPEPALALPDRRYETASTQRIPARLEALVSESSSAVVEEIQHRKLHPGYLEITHIPVGDHHWEHLDLLRAAERSVIRHTGWPIGVVLHRDEARPHPQRTGISTMIYSETFRRSLDYWRLEHDGAYYFARTFGEDEREGVTAGEVLYFDTRIWRIAEGFEHAQSLYENLGVDPSEGVYFQIRHVGLLGRTLGASQPDRYMRPIPRESAVGEAVWTGEVTLGQMGTGLRELVRRVSSDLFVMFDFFQLADSVLDDVLGQYLSSVI